MSFVDTSASRVLVNDKHLSGSISGWTFTAGRNYSTVTSILDAGMRYVPGLKHGSVNVVGMFNSAVGDINEEIVAAVGVDDGLLWTIFPAGITVGLPACIAVSELADYKITSAIGSAVNIAVDGTADDGCEIGVVLHALAAETADDSETSVDNAASSSNGGVATLHLTDLTGLDDITVIVEHSTNNSVWATLLSFTLATTETSERKTVTGTVNRYVRATWDVTGTGSATFAVAFARR